MRPAGLLLLLVALVAGACAGSSNSGDASTISGRSGEEIFATRILGPNPGCITCHSMDPDTTLVGPSIAGIGARAGSRVSGLSAEDYLRQSIINPSAFIVDGFDDGKMPSDLSEVLTGPEIDAVVAYLLTLG
ncbi:MAG: c-type cytochrome [Acidimicrobiia bacterium]|nr:c-type cytochrome [Acidimicrobiia bacterium]